MIDAPSPIERFTLNALIELVPGTSRRVWLADLIPDLVARGVLRKRGRAWFARRSDIESALLVDANDLAARRRARTR